MSFIIHVTWRGRTTAVSIPLENPTLESLGEAFERELGASFETQKLLLPGRKGQVAPARDRGRLATEAGLINGCKALLLASSAEDVSYVRASRDVPGMRSFEDELKRAARRRRTDRSSADSQPPRADYTFGAYQAWQRPGLHPPPAEALKLLYRLANDPGILAIMASHRYRVGLLSEMAPEGKVGISPVCVLGVNIDAGREISLRLRTDDLKGFRKYERIRETMIHELAHMEFGEHDSNFKRLNSQLGRECADINARYVRGHSLLDDVERRVAAAAGRSGPSGLDDSDLIADDVSAVMAATARFSGKTLRQLAALGGGGSGSSAPSTSKAPPSGIMETAAVAVSVRLAGSSAGQPEVFAGSGPAVGSDGSSDDGDGDGGSDDPVRRFEHFDAVTERAEAAARRLGSLDELPEPLPQPQSEAQPHPQPQREDCGSGVRESGDEGENSSKLKAAAAVIVSAALADEQSTAARRRPAVVEADGEAGSDAVDVAERVVTAAPMVTSGSGSSPGVGCLPSSTARAAFTSTLASVPTDAPSADLVSEGHRHCSSGPSFSAAAEAQHPDEGRPSPPAPPRRLTLQYPAQLSEGADSESVEAVLTAAQTKLRQAWGALMLMAAAAHSGDGHAGSGSPYTGSGGSSAVTVQDVATALDTLETIIGNAVHFPTEDRYRRVRLGNAVFQRRVGRLPGGLELLRVAGFVEEVMGSGPELGASSEGEAVLRLRRNDPGLLWLVLSAVQEARGQVAAQLPAAVVDG